MVKIENMKSLFDPELEKFIEETPKEDIDSLEIRVLPCNSSINAYEFSYVTIRAVGPEAHDRIYQRTTHLLEQKERIYNLTGNTNAWLTNIINSRRKER